MPGRQNIGHTVQNLSRKRKRNATRILDAFAIAQEEVPDRVGVRRSRLRDLESDDFDAQKERMEEDGEGFGGASRARKLRYGNSEDYERGSDSEGNEWMIGAVATDDDSSLDSDDALGVSDQERSRELEQKSRKSSRVLDRAQDHEIDLSEGAIDRYASDEESEDFAVNAINLDAALDSDSDLGPTHMVEGRSSSPMDGKSSASLSFKNSSEDDQGTELSISDSEEADAQGGKAKTLQTLIASLETNASNKATRNDIDLAQEAMPPSEYRLNPRKKLTVEDLLPTVTDPTFRRSLKLMTDKGKKPLKSGKGTPGKLSVPLPKRQQDRLDRAAAFEKSKETLNRWTDTVKRNRRAEHLIFPLQESGDKSAKNMKRMLPVTQSHPITNLESTIQDLLVQSGLAENGKTQDKQIQELEELATQSMPIEEIRARQAELRQARELLFREEIRAKRIKKIKSKSYRRVHRKERERNLLHDKEAMAAAGLVPSDDEQERLDRQRAEERMGQRHRESRWAKGVKGTRRAAWDEDAREGVTEMLRKDEELRRRMRGKDVKDEDSLDDESESAEDDDSEEEEAFAARMQKQLDKLHTVDTPGNRLSTMRFMKKAEAGRKAQNDEALMQLRRDLDGEDLGENSEDEKAGQGRRRYGPQKSVVNSIKPANATMNEFEEQLELDEENYASRVQDVDEEEVEITTNKPPRAGSSTRLDSKNMKTTSPKVSRETSKVEENPWLVAPKRSSRTRRTAEDSIIISTTPQLSARSSQPAKTFKPLESAEHGNESDESGASFTGFSPPPLSPRARNEALIREAFAADDVLAEESFAAEKAALAAEEEPSKPTSDALPGWGNWVGPGLSKKERRDAKRAPTANGTSNGIGMLPKNASEDGIPAAMRKDHKLQKVIISEKRVPKNAKFLALELPHPFESRAQYERSLRLPMGPEFTTKETFQGMTKPRVLLKPGIIAPMRKPLA